MWKMTVCFFDGAMPGKLPQEGATVEEEFDTKAAARTRILEIMDNGYTVNSDGVDYLFPSSAVLYVRLEEG